MNQALATTTDIRKFRRELYRDETETPDKIAGLFARGYVSIVASQPGAGKTWITELIICQLSQTDQPFINFIKGEENKISPTMKIVLLAGETGSALLNQRLAQTTWSYDPSNVSIYNALDFAKGGVPYLINTPEGRNTLVQIMQAERPDIIFIDTLISWHVADESKQAEMVELYTFIMRIADVFKCAVVINHHTRKKSSNNTSRNLTQDDVIGSSAGIRLARDVYILNKADDNSIILEHAKSWDKKLQTISFRIVNDGYSTDIAYKTNATGTQKDNSARFEEFISQLSENSLITIQQTAATLKISPQLARHYIMKYKQNGRLQEVTLGGQHAFKLTNIEG